MYFVPRAHLNSEAKCLEEALDLYLKLLESTVEEVDS